MKEITADEEKNKVKYIDNPLPVPKRRAHKQMEYSIEVDENDDFDIKDMTGMDFYDIQ